uniref:Uncharacterized protein n=1 Tax=Vespula pensylvanica TaxID=30213 RepID=A0A834UFG4_VESPE|nr:hypothetical protein H0235_003677 [Vespula pensylvanica]
MKVPVETKSIVVLSSRDGATSITHRQLVPRNRRNIRSGSPVGCVTCNANCRERCTKAGSGSYRDCVVWQRTLERRRREEISVNQDEKCAFARIVFSNCERTVGSRKLAGSRTEGKLAARQVASRVPPLTKLRTTLKPVSPRAPLTYWTQ